MATPTFVDVITELRSLKSAFDNLAAISDAGKSICRTSAEKELMKSLGEIGTTLSKRIQSLTTDVSKLAINSSEDIEKIMEALSK
jgi:hypothetical protein